MPARSLCFKSLPLIFCVLPRGSLPSYAPFRLTRQRIEAPGSLSCLACLPGFAKKTRSRVQFSPRMMDVIFAMRTRSAAAVLISCPTPSISTCRSAQAFTVGTQSPGFCFFPTGIAFNLKTVRQATQNLRNILYGDTYTRSDKDAVQRVRLASRRRGYTHNGPPAHTPSQTYRQ